MKLPPINTQPNYKSYDVVIIGGAMIGSSVAWWLSDNSDFQGRVLVVEKDPTYELSSTAHSNSCIRQQFSSAINVQISQFAAKFIKEFREFMHNDPAVPEQVIHNFGYMYLADSKDFAAILRRDQKLQSTFGAGTQIMSPDQIAADYPFYNLDGIILGSHNKVDEGYFDGGSLFDWWRRKSCQNGVEYVAGEVVAIGQNDGRVSTVTLADGQTISCGAIVNATGPRAARTAAMAGLSIPVEPRRRYTYVFDAERPLDRDLPLTIDPSGIHVRTDGKYYMAGGPPDGDDLAVAPDDFSFDHGLWENKVWPTIATRVPALEAVKVINSWVGHYAYNTLDQNAIVGWHPDLTNFMLVNGFSGHGFQQAPAMGRGVAELVLYGEYRSLDLTPLGFDRIVLGETLTERAVI